MPETFTLTSEALRNALILYVDVADQTGAWSPSAAEWEAQGYKTEDAALEFNPDKTTVTDILGDTYTTVEKLERQMAFEPNTIRPIANRGKMNQLLHEYTRRGQLSKMQEFKVMIAYGYISKTSSATPPVISYEADVYPASTITPQSLGGSSRVNFPYDIDLGGEPMFGTVNQMLPSPIFTPEA